MRISQMDGRLIRWLVLGLLLVVEVRGSVLFQSKVSIPTECPKHDVGNQTVQLPHETDCTKYYMCSHGKKYEMQCPFFVDEQDRLYFNPETQSCDWPENVSCPRSKAVRVVHRFARKDDLSPECLKLEGSSPVAVFLPHETDCTMYYMCSHGRKYLMNCPVDADGNGLYFNVAVQTCDWRWNVRCTPGSGPATEPPTTEPPTTEPPTTEPPTTEPPTTEPPTTEPPTTEPPTTEPPTTEPPTTEPPTTEPPTTEPPTTEPPTTEPPTTEPPTTEPPTTEPPTTEPPTTEPPTTEPPTTEPPTTEPPTTEPPTTEPPTTEPPTTEPPTTEPPTTEPPTTEPPTTEPPTTEPPPTPEPNDVAGCKNTCPNSDPYNKITAMPHKDCRKWCRCQYHMVKVHSCPANFHFSPKLKRCAKPELAGCVDESGKLYRKLNEHDEALMNILRYNKIFRL